MLLTPLAVWHIIKIKNNPMNFKIKPLQQSIRFALLFFLMTLTVQAQTTVSEQKESEEILAAALEEMEALKEEIKAINKQIQSGLPLEEADSLKQVRTKARLKAYKQKVEQLNRKTERENTSSSNTTYHYSLSVPPPMSVGLNRDSYTISMGLVAAFGFNTMLTAGEELQDNPYKIFGSRFFELGWSWAKPLQEEKKNLFLKYGLSLMVNGYKLIDNQYLTKQNGEVLLQSFSAPLTKSKLTISQLVFPLHLHFGRLEHYTAKRGKGWPATIELHQRTPLRSLRFGIGGYAGFNVRNVHKLKYREEGHRKKIKHKDHLNVNQFIVGLSGYVSIGPDFYLYSKYELTPVFKNQASQSNHLALGLRMNFD